MPGEPQELGIHEVTNQVLPVPAPGGMLKLAGETFQLGNVLGEGGFGKVFQGYQPAINQFEALKYIDLSSLSPAQRAEQISHLREEAQAMAALETINHPALPRYHGLYLGSNQAVFRLEYIEGQNLEERIIASQQALPEADLRRVIRSIGGALALLHQPPGSVRALLPAGHNRLLHRDLKPANIIATNQPEAPYKLLDFGNAQTIRHHQHSAAGLTRQLRDQRYGTPPYADPLYHWSGMMLPQGDVYSFAATLLHLAAPNLMQGLSDEPYASHRPVLAELVDQTALSPELKTLLKRSLSLDIGQRPQTMQEFLETLPLAKNEYFTVDAAGQAELSLDCESLFSPDQRAALTNLIELAALPLAGRYEIGATPASSVKTGLELESVWRYRTDLDRVVHLLAELYRSATPAQHAHLRRIMLYALVVTDDLILPNQSKDHAGLGDRSLVTGTKADEEVGRSIADGQNLYHPLVQHFLHPKVREALGFTEPDAYSLRALSTAAKPWYALMQFDVTQGPADHEKAQKELLPLLLQKDLPLAQRINLLPYLDRHSFAFVKQLLDREPAVMLDPAYHDYLTAWARGDYVDVYDRRWAIPLAKPYPINQRVAAAVVERTGEHLQAMLRYIDDLAIRSRLSSDYTEIEKFKTTILGLFRVGLEQEHVWGTGTKLVKQFEAWFLGPSGHVLIDKVGQRLNPIDIQLLDLSIPPAILEKMSFFRDGQYLRNHIDWLAREITQLSDGEITQTLIRLSRLPISPNLQRELRIYHDRVFGPYHWELIRRDLTLAQSIMVPLEKIFGTGHWDNLV